MTRQIYFLIFFLFSSLSLFAQPEKMNRWINDYKSQTISNGYVLLDSGGLNINKDWGLIFDIKDYYSGDYIIIIIVDDCTSCDIEIKSTNLINGKRSSEKPSMQYAENMGVAGLTFKQPKYTKADIMAFTTSTSYRYGYGMLFKK